MNRRSWLSALGLSAFTSLEARSSVRQATARETRLFSLETFQLKNGADMAPMHAYLSGALRPFLNSIHTGPSLWLEAVIAPQPQILAITGFSGFEEMARVQSQLAAHPHVQKERARMEQGARAIIERHDSQLLMATPDSPELTGATTGLFEVRVYHAAASSQLTALHRRLLGAQPLFPRAGIHPILSASTITGQHLPGLTYLIPFASLAHREQAWERLASERDSIANQASVVHIALYRPA